MPKQMTVDLTGRLFGQLTVIERAPTPPGSARAFWLCRCACGTVVAKNGKYLLRGDTTSCGCAQRAMRAAGNPKYGTDAQTHRREYSIWRSMKSRCHVTSSSNYRFYGARGVTVCDRWRDDFSAFLADMGPCPQGMTIDRIDPNGNYEADNCRWATWETQRTNKREHHAARPFAFSASAR